LDPGETTGWAFFKDGHLSQFGQIETVDEDKQPRWTFLDDLFKRMQPTYVVCEDYRVYAHKLERHANSQVVTLRLIGGIDYMCWNDARSNSQTLLSIPICYQMATQHKSFITDDRLKDWGFWLPNMKHSRDAVRAGLYFLIVTNRPKGDR